MRTGEPCDLGHLRHWAIGAALKFGSQTRMFFMADSKKIRDYRDRDRKNIQEDYQVGDWSNQLGVS